MLPLKRDGSTQVASTDLCSLEHGSAINAQKIPGCSIVPIRVLKNGNSRLLKEKVFQPMEDKNVYELSSHDDLDGNGFSKSVTPSHPLFHAILLFSGIDLDKPHVDPSKQDSLKRKDSKSVNDYLSWMTYHSKVHQTIGSSIDPFYNMPKFKNARANTGEYYYHCMDVEPAWTFS
jgi:hypothetical protein